jgi:hypothetical protein
VSLVEVTGPPGHIGAEHQHNDVLGRLSDRSPTQDERALAVTLDSAALGEQCEG